MCRTFGALLTMGTVLSRPRGRAYALPALRTWTLAVMSEPLPIQEIPHAGTSRLDFGCHAQVSANTGDFFCRHYEYDRGSVGTSAVGAAVNSRTRERVVRCEGLN